MVSVSFPGCTLVHPISEDENGNTLGRGNTLIWRHQLVQDGPGKAQLVTPFYSREVTQDGNLPLGRRFSHPGILRDRRFQHLGSRGSRDREAAFPPTLGGLKCSLRFHTKGCQAHLLKSSGMCASAVGFSLSQRRQIQSNLPCPTMTPPRLIFRQPSTRSIGSREWTDSPHLLF